MTNSICLMTHTTVTASTSLPWITLVTPSFNQGRYLRATIESVLSQGYPRLRYIVMDGGSTDGSVEILEEYADRLTHWESHPDGGQTAAIRRGFELGGGEVLNWINSDDYLEPGALMRVAALAQANPSAALLAFPVRNVVDGPAGIQEQSVSVPGALHLENMLLLRRPRARRHQPGVFFRRCHYDRIGGIHPSFHICMDFDLHLRILAAGGWVAYGSGAVANFRIHALAKTAGARSALTFVREYSRSMEAVAATTPLKPNRAPLAPLVATALVTALRQMSVQQLRAALRAVSDLGYLPFIRGCASFAVSRYLLRRRDELP